MYIVFKKFTSFLCALALCLAPLTLGSQAGDVPEDKAPVMASEPSDAVATQDKPGDPCGVNSVVNEEPPGEPVDGNQ